MGYFREMKGGGVGMGLCLFSCPDFVLVVFRCVCKSCGSLPTIPHPTHRLFWLVFSHGKMGAWIQGNSSFGLGDGPKAGPKLEQELASPWGWLSV